MCLEIQLLIFHQDILDQVEVSKFYTETYRGEQDIASRPVGRRLLQYIDDNWKDDQTLDYISTQLTPLISQSIERTLKEKIPELDGCELPKTQGSVSQSGQFASSVISPQSTNIGTPLPAETIEAGSESDLIRSSITTDTPNGRTAPIKRKNPDSASHQYTSKLWEHASLTGLNLPEFQQEQLATFPSRWACTVSFAGLSERGEGRSAKLAKHEASRQLYLKIDQAD
jgi:hypothetical protein